MPDIEIPDEFVIEDPETLKVLGDPLRLQILEKTSQLNETGLLATAKQLAEELGELQTKLYYHLNLLEEHGLLVMAETALVSGIVERRYKVRARRFRAELDMDEGRTDLRQEEIDMMLGPLHSILDRTRTLAEESIQAGRVDDDESNEILDEMHIQLRVVHLMAKEADDLAERLQSLLLDFKSAPGSGRSPYAMTTVFLPIRSPDRGSDDD